MCLLSVSFHATDLNVPPFYVFLVEYAITWGGPVQYDDDGLNTDGSAAFVIFVNPLVSWIWAGGAIIILGVILGNVGERRRVFELQVARVTSPLPA